MADKKHNMSLFFYTGLIFIVAVLLIVIAFFSQSHFNQSQPAQVEIDGISQRAAVLSDENKTLLEENIAYKSRCEEYDRKINELNERIASLEEKARMSEALLSANGYVSKKLYGDARSVLSKIDASVLSDDERILYNSLVKKVGKD